MNVKETLEALAERLQTTGVSTIFGEPISAEGRTIIPVARVAYGFGSGGGMAAIRPEHPSDRKGEGAGGGGGARAVPAGVVEITREHDPVSTIRRSSPTCSRSSHRIWVGACVLEVDEPERPTRLTSARSWRDEVRMPATRARSFDAPQQIALVTPPVLIISMYGASPVTSPPCRTRWSGDHCVPGSGR
jgi:uncharacterized spore protein YtfJ